jgi:hypothetical protein
MLSSFSHFATSRGGGFYDLGMEEKEETKCAELETELEPAPAGRYLLVE